jgi:TonB family protein
MWGFLRRCILAAWKFFVWSTAPVVFRSTRACLGEEPVTLGFLRLNALPLRDFLSGAAHARKESMTDSADRPIFRLLPPPEGRRRSFVTSIAVNLVILAICICAGMIAPKVIERHYEQTELIAPILSPPQKIKLPRPPTPRKPVVEPKPVHTEAKLTAPPVPHIKPHLALTPQPRPALAAAMPAQTRLVRASVKPVHLGDTFGVTPNPNAMRTANVAALGNPYGDMRGPAVAPHGLVKSTGIGDSMRPGVGGGGGGSGFGDGIANAAGRSTSIEVISKPPPQYSAEARQLGIEGNVVLSVTFLANGQVVVHGVLRGLGHGLDEEAIRVARQIRFNPATVGGRRVDVTTHVTIAFQLA